MKLLVLLAVLGIAFWVWRSSRIRDKAIPPASRAASAQEMLECRVCGLHVPRPDALVGELGVYCSEAHRHGAES